ERAQGRASVPGWATSPSEHGRPRRPIAFREADLPRILATFDTSPAACPAETPGLSELTCRPGATPSRLGWARRTSPAVCRITRPRGIRPATEYDSPPADLRAWRQIGYSLFRHDRRRSYTRRASPCPRSATRGTTVASRGRSYSPASRAPRERPIASGRTG